MRLWLDLGDGNGAVEYTGALMADPPRQVDSNSKTETEAFAIERRRGAYTRCRGTLDCGAAGLPVPVAGSQLLVRSDAGQELFRGYLTGAPQRMAPVLHAVAPVRFMAVETAYLTNIALDASLQPSSAKTHSVVVDTDAVRLAESALLAERPADVTVIGSAEPEAYVTELFQGDGTTATFALTDKPFVAAGNSALIDDSFAGTQFRSAVWRFADTGQHLRLGSGGLRLTGGNGFDGQTYMAAQAPVELGGTLCAELSGVLLQAGSDGVLLGMYGNVVTRANCFAGIRVKATAGAQSLVALLNGAEVGTAMNYSVGHSYTMRVRLHCAEAQRVLRTYQAVVDGALQTFGGGLVEASMQVVVEVLDEGLASSTPAMVLYAGAVSSSLAQAIFAPVNSVSLQGSVQRCRLRQQGSVWVTTTAADGTVTARRPGALDTGEDYQLQSRAVVFFPGRVPLPGDRVTVLYRRTERAEARLQDSSLLAAMQQQGLPGLHSEVCRVTEPEPRSAADCAAAAAALLAFYGSAARGVVGTCTLANPLAEGDVMPGDSVLLPLASTPLAVPVETVTIRSAHAVPEVLQYGVDFAQRESNGLSFQREAGAPADAIVPAALYAAPTTAALPQLTVSIAGESALQVDAGVTPPVGGGFEVRRHDGGWGPDVAGASPDSELVLRSPVRSFSVPRAAFAERFYVRMYDGSEVPGYSAQSSLVVTHLPLG